MKAILGILACAALSACMAQQDVDAESRHYRVIESIEEFAECISSKRLGVVDQTWCSTSADCPEQKPCECDTGPSIYRRMGEADSPCEEMSGRCLEWPAMPKYVCYDA
jgi:hypothetical protein